MDSSGFKPMDGSLPVALAHLVVDEVFNDINRHLANVLDGDMLLETAQILAIVFQRSRERFFKRQWRRNSAMASSSVL